MSPPPPTPPGIGSWAPREPPARPTDPPAAGGGSFCTARPPFFPHHPPSSARESEQKDDLAKAEARRSGGVGRVTPFAGIRARDPVRLGGKLGRDTRPPPTTTTLQLPIRDPPGRGYPLGSPGKAHGAPLALCRVRWGRGWGEGDQMASRRGPPGTSAPLPGEVGHRPAMLGERRRCPVLLLFPIS